MARDPLDDLESDEEYQRRMQERAKGVPWKKPGDPDVIEMKFDGEGNPVPPKPPESPIERGARRRVDSRRTRADR